MNPLQFILVLLLRVYRLSLSPLKIFVFGPSAQCRFTPSCSAYGIEAIAKHGAFRGSWLAARRVCRCHPWGDCGSDPVPPRHPSTHHRSAPALAGISSSPITPRRSA